MNQQDDSKKVQALREAVTLANDLHDNKDVEHPLIQEWIGVKVLKRYKNQIAASPTQEDVIEVCVVLNALWSTRIYPGDVAKWAKILRDFLSSTQWKQKAEEEKLKYVERELMPRGRKQKQDKGIPSERVPKSFLSKFFHLLVENGENTFPIFDRYAREAAGVILVELGVEKLGGKKEAKYLIPESISFTQYCSRIKKIPVEPKDRFRRLDRLLWLAGHYWSEKLSKIWRDMFQTIREDRSYQKLLKSLDVLYGGKPPWSRLTVRDKKSEDKIGIEIDVFDWEPGENFIGLSTGEDFHEGEEWFLYYPWQGEEKIDHRYENGRLWVNGRVAGVDLRKVKLDDLEDKTTVVTVKALPTQLNQVQKLPNVLVLEIVEGEGDLSPLAKLTTLTKLTMWPRINDTHLAYVERLINLRELHVYSDRITEAGLVYVKGLKKLRHLDLLPLGNGNGWLTDVGLGCLADLVNLRELSLCWEKVTDKGLSHIKGMTELRELTLDGNKITDEGLRHLRGLKELTELSLDFTEITDDGLKHLSHLTNLKELSLMATAISDDGLKHLKWLHSLETLILIDTPITDAGLSELQGLPNIKLINLSETKVTKEGIAQFKQALPHCEILLNVKKVRSSKSRYTSGSG